MTDLNGVNDAFKNGFTIKLENRGSNSSGITFELKSIFEDMARKGLIKDKDGKGITKREVFNMYQKLNEIHKTTGKSTDYTKMQVGQEFKYTAQELKQLAEASGFEISSTSEKPVEEENISTPSEPSDVDTKNYEVTLPEVVIVGKKPSKDTAEAKPQKPETTAESVSDLPNKYSIGKIDTPFEQDTLDMLYTNTNVQTNFLKNANSLLGTVEYMNQSELNPEERQKTQAAIIGEYGTSNHQWCAHAVSTIAERSGIKIGGHYAQVQQFINWGNQNGIYNKVPETAISERNFEEVRAAKAEAISQQLPSMNEGDLIIWKSPYAAKTNVGLKLWAASHIGILESVDKENGTITVIEGNANIPKSDDKYERYVVQTTSQGINGAQVIGEPVELNRTDGLIRKVYTIDELAKFGYSGFINMQSRLV